MVLFYFIDTRAQELRCPITLTAEEKDMARRIVQAFKQNVCGFDLLKSHVCIIIVSSTH